MGPLPFSSDLYLVRSNSTSGIEILDTANKLNSVKGVESATPNFIQSVTRESVETVSEEISYMPKIKGWVKLTNLLGFAWQLDSIPLKRCLQQKISNLKSLQTCLQKNNQLPASGLSPTDLRVTDAWKHSNKGSGVVVAVLDSVIQWDHPDLKDSVYSVTSPDKCPQELHGWDFSSNTNSLPTDPDFCKHGNSDTRISPTELAFLRAKFQDTFKLDDDQLIRKYSKEASQVKQQNLNYSPQQVADDLRYVFRKRIARNFTGLM